MVGKKVDGQILFGARSEKPKILFGARGEKPKILCGAKWQLRKILFGSQRVKIISCFYASIIVLGSGAIWTATTEGIAVTVGLSLICVILIFKFPLVAYDIELEADHWLKLYCLYTVILINFS